MRIKSLYMRYDAHGVLIYPRLGQSVLVRLIVVVASTVDAIQQIWLESFESAMDYDYGSSSVEHIHDGNSNDFRELCVPYCANPLVFT